MHYTKRGVLMGVFNSNEQEDKFIQLLSEPRTIGQIAYVMDWAYATTAQKLQVLEGGGVVKKIKSKSGQTLFFVQRSEKDVDKRPKHTKSRKK